jgi:hypothetical protein
MRPIVCRVDEVALGAAPGLVSMRIESPGPDGRRREVWSGSALEQSVRAALAHPRLPRLRLRFAPVETDQVRIDARFAPQEEVTTVVDVRVFGDGCGQSGRP